MSIKPELLEILCCPKTKEALQELNATELESINAAISNGKLIYNDESPVEKPLTEGLITTSKDRVYRIDDDIPIMLIDQSIPLDGIL